MRIHTRIKIFDKSAMAPQAWCPSGVASCPCPGLTKYPMQSWRGPHATAVFANSSRRFASYTPSFGAEQCRSSRFARPAAAHNACLPEARVDWNPGRWQQHRSKDTLPAGIGLRHLERACDGIRIHLAPPTHALNTSWWSDRARILFARKYAPSSWVSSREQPTSEQVASRRARKAACIEQLQGFKPMVCSLKDVLVWGHARRMQSANGSTYYLPPEVVSEQRAHDEACPHNCNARPTNVVSCGGHAVIGRNLMGIAYYHTLYETLGSVAFALDLLSRKHHSLVSRVRLLENLCIPADGTQAYLNMRSRTCVDGFFGNGPATILVNMLELLGISVDQLQHYPYVRQWEGPAVHLDRATFDCSPSVYRNFWHVLKLREAFHARLSRVPSSGPLTDPPRQPPLPSRILVLNRNLCERPATSNRSAAPVARCHGGRSVKNQKGIMAAISARFSGSTRWRVHEFLGTEPYVEQARAFWEAAVVVGPHGAQQSNMIFCQEGAAVIEFVSGHPNPGKTSMTNSALYAGYASVFALLYFIIVSESPNGSYDAIHPQMVVHVVEQALAARDGQQSAALEVLKGSEESTLVQGYGTYHSGWPTGW